MRVCSSTIGWGVASLVGIIINTVLIGFNVSRMSVEVLTALSFLYALQCLCVGGCWLYSWGFPLLTIFSFMCMSWLGIWTIKINKGEDELTLTPSPELVLPTGAPDLPTGLPDQPTGTPDLPPGLPDQPAGTPDQPAGTPDLPPGTSQPAGADQSTGGSALPAGTSQPAGADQPPVAEQFRNYCY